MGKLTDFFTELKRRRVLRVAAVLIRRWAREIKLQG